MIEKFYCKKCGKALLEAELIEGTIIKDCPKCKTQNIYVARPARQEGGNTLGGRDYRQTPN